MLLIGLREFALSCSSAFFGLCFRCASVNALFCRAKPPNASFFSIFTRARPWGALKQTLRVHLGPSRDLRRALSSPKIAGHRGTIKRIVMHIDLFLYISWKNACHDVLIFT